MKKYTDKELAAFMMEKRQHNGVWKGWRQPWRWAFFFAFLAFWFGLGTLAQSWWFCGFVFGLGFGICSRDAAWLRQQRATWPFYDKVMDWKKVESIASGEPSS